SNGLTAAPVSSVGFSFRANRERSQHPQCAPRQLSDDLPPSKRSWCNNISSPRNRPGFATFQTRSQESLGNDKGRDFAIWLPMELRCATLQRWHAFAAW